MTDGDKTPSRCRAIGEVIYVASRQAVSPIAGSGKAGKCAPVIGVAGKDTDRHCFKYPGPLAPFRDLHQVIGPH